MNDDLFDPFPESNILNLNFFNLTYLIVNNYQEDLTHKNYYSYTNNKENAGYLPQDTVNKRLKKSMSFNQHTAYGMIRNKKLENQHQEAYRWRA